MNKIDRNVMLSTLWVFVMFNMLAADILSFMYPGFLKEIMTGYAGQVQISPVFLLVAAIFLEIPILMIFLSRVLPHKANRWANIIAAAVTILFVVGGGSAYPHYIFIEIMGVVAMLAIMLIAWKWSPSKG